MYKKIFQKKVKKLIRFDAWGKENIQTINKLSNYKKYY